MVTHLSRSALSSFVPFPLYKPNFPPLISLLSTEIYDQSAPGIIVRPYRSAALSIINAFLPSNFNLVSTHFLLKNLYALFYFLRLYHHVYVMSGASSNHSFVRNGAGYDEVYPLGHKDLDNQSEERSLLASSPSSRDEGLEMEGPKDDFIQDLEDTEPPIQSVVGLDGL